MKHPTQRIAEAVVEYVTDAHVLRLADILGSWRTVDDANAQLQQLTGIRRFFPDVAALEEYRRVFSPSAIRSESETRREWGDFQTPPHLASQVCEYLASRGLTPQVIVEPTYGAGNFILAALQVFPTATTIYGVEIQEKYAWHLKTALLVEALSGRRYTANIELHQDNFFTHVFPASLANARSLLLIGNPPWITNAELSALASHNVPQKRNLKALNGLEALTGKSNFDLGEYVLLRLLDLFAQQSGTLAILCKNAVIKNIVEQLPRRRYPVTNIQALGIDARRDFGAAVDASLLIMDLGASHPTFTCQAATLDTPHQISHTFGWVGQRFVANVASYAAGAQLDGASPFTWRQGIKHDCAPILELEEKDARLFNRQGEEVEVENEYVYRLLKGSDLRSFEARPPRRQVIVPQRVLGEDTTLLQKTAPRLWAYLTQHRRHFEQRKSSIYQGKPPFSIFGIGAYSFAPYKVAIAGLYKEPCFTLMTPIDRRPVLLDDTCYFLGFAAYREALLTATVLNSSLVKQFLQSLVFTDAKRPYTKEVLMRIDLAQAVQRLTLADLHHVWQEQHYAPQTVIDETAFADYQRLCLNAAGKQLETQLGLGF